MQINPREKAVVICESFMSPRPLIESIGHVLFRSFGVKSIYFMLTNVLPMYATGQDTGIVVECGFQSMQILPIVRSRLCMEAFEVSYTGGVHIEKRLNEMLIDDNVELVKRHASLKDTLNFSASMIDDLKTRALLVMQKDQKDLYLSSEDNTVKMKKKITSLGKQYKDVPGMSISLYTRYTSMEILYGNITEEESNLAYSILTSIKKVLTTYFNPFAAEL